MATRVVFNVPIMAPVLKCVAFERCLGFKHVLEPVSWVCRRVLSRVLLVNTLFAPAQLLQSVRSSGLATTGNLIRVSSGWDSLLHRVLLPFISLFYRSDLYITTIGLFVLSISYTKVHQSKHRVSTWPSACKRRFLAPASELSIHRRMCWKP
jgi:hypothetical protein